jgi:hypothetical protein
MKDGEELFVLEEYEGIVYRVVGLVLYEKTLSPLTWINNQFVGTLDALSGRYGEPNFVRKHGISFEAAWVVDSYTVWLFASVGLDGSSKVQLTYIDRDVQDELLKDIQEQGKNL